MTGLELRAVVKHYDAGELVRRALASAVGAELDGVRAGGEPGR